MSRIQDKRPAKSPLREDRNLRSKSDCCRICKSPIDPVNAQESSVQCHKCDNVFHCSCAGVSHNFFVYYIKQKNSPWFCYTCHCETLNSAASSVSAIKKIEDAAAKMNKDVQCLTTEVLKMRNSDSSWKQEFEIKIDSVIDKKIEEKLQSLQSVVTNPTISSDGISGATTHSSHSSYRKNLVISGLPETENEDTVQVIKKLARHMNYTQSNYMDNCFRIDRRGLNDSDKPATILLKFTTELARDSFLRCYFNYIRKRRLIPRDIELPGEERIYINEHLNPVLQPLLKKAVSLRREGRIEQVSSHSSHLSIKINVNGRTKWLRIFNETGLAEATGSEGPSQ